MQATDVPSRHQSIHDSGFHRIIESVPNGLFLIDQSGHIVLANSEAEKLFGYEKNELNGRVIEDLVPTRFRSQHPTDRGNFAHHPVKRQMGAGRDLAGLTKDNREIPVEIGLNHILFDGETFIVASVVDLTERKRQEQKFRTIVEAVPSGIVMIDQDGTIMLSNSETERMFGYEKGELIGKKVEVLVPRRIREHHPTLRKQFGQQPQKRQMGAGRDLTGVKKDGTEIPVEIGLNPVQTGDGTFTVASIVDITARKGIENELHKAYEELQGKNQEMEQFVYTVSHDLKAPLVTSMSFLGFLREDLEDRRFDEVMDSLDRLEKAHKRMQDLLNDLLQLSRAGRLEMDFETLDLRSVLEGASAYIAEKLEAKGVQLLLPSDLPAIKGDRKRLHQVFENLLSNAVKYGVDSTHPVIEILWRDGGESVHICVKDYGPGIESQYHQKIFGLFQRLHTDRDGTGVGLTIVSRIMQMHGGRVWVESEPGQGAEFWISLPRVQVEGGSHV